MAKEYLRFSLAISLVWFNWFFEWLKWSRIAQGIALSDRSVIRKGFYAGMVTGFVTPSALGNFLGRMTEVQNSLRAKVVSFTFFANAAQFIVSLFFGLFSLVFIENLPFTDNGHYIKIAFLLIISFLLLLFFNVHKVPGFSKLITQRIPSVQMVGCKDKLLFLSYSALRYFVFSFQFYLVLLAFQPELDISIWFWIWYLYLWSTLSPSLLIGKLFIRESLAVFVLSRVGVDLPIALIASLIVWLINNALPSIYAYIKWKKHVVV